VGAAAKLLLSTDVFAGLRTFTPDQGIGALERIMSSQEVQIGVSEVSDLSLFKSMFNQGRYLEELRSEGGGENRFEKDASFIQDIRSGSGGDEDRDREGRIRLYIEGIFRKTLNIPTDEVLDPTRNFADLGVDSLMIMEMKNRFQGLLEGGQTLSLSAIQENRTIQSLSSHLAELMEQKQEVSKSLPELLATDSELFPDIGPAEIPAVLPSKFKNVLLTGNTVFGFRILLAH
jgi:aryl carrier-like protein